MPRTPWPWLLLALWTAPAPAQAPDPVEGNYQSETREVGSTLVLAPDGRFLWVLAYGALDLAGEGRWRRAADGAILLDSDPGIVEPRFELVGRSRDQQPGVEIRLACDTGDAQHFLSVLTEHANGERALHRFQNLAFRTYGEPPSEVTAVQLGSESFDLLSERYPVDPREANILTFRFVPNDLGRQVFRDERLTIADGVVTMNLRGMPIRYRREASAAGLEVPRLPSIPRALPDREPVPLAVTLGEPLAGLQARAGDNLDGLPGQGMQLARGPVDLRLTYGERSFDFGRVEGGRQRLIVGSDFGDSVVDTLRFGHQAAPLTLDEALTRAQALKAWLEQNGFAVLPGAEYADRDDFAVDGQVVGEPPLATDWASAARVLADEERAITEMHLYMRRTADYRVAVLLENSRRRERETCPHSDWPADGRDWRLLVEIMASRLPPPTPEGAQE